MKRDEMLMNCKLLMNLFNSIINSHNVYINVTICSHLTLFTDCSHIVHNSNTFRL